MAIVIDTTEQSANIIWCIGESGSWVGEALRQSLYLKTLCL